MNTQLEFPDFFDPDYEQYQKDNGVFDDPRDKSVGDMVSEFAYTAEQEQDAERALRLLEEEYAEWQTAYAGPSDTDELKELADLVYVIYGYADSCGFNLDEAVRRVHDNNMGRMFQEDGTIKRREDGKVLKNPLYPKVNLEDLV